MQHAQHSNTDRAEQTRRKIVAAAIREFSEYGLAGARTDAIAGAAKVNKALLYYYFKSKSDLYAVALKEVAGKVMESALTAAERGGTAGERLLHVALNHFDRILTQHEFQNLMQQEMVRFRLGESAHIPWLAQTLFKPLLMRLEDVVYEGIRTRELCKADRMQVIYAILGANVFYFLSAPMMRSIVSFEPFDPATLESRRKAAVRFLGSALFVDRKHGAKLAKRVLTETPMPKIRKFPEWRKS